MFLAVLGSVVQYITTPPGEQMKFEKHVNEDDVANESEADDDYVALGDTYPLPPTAGNYGHFPDFNLLGRSTQFYPVRLSVRLSRSGDRGFNIKIMFLFCEFHFPGICARGQKII